jgi:hypothetical protein
MSAFSDHAPPENEAHRKHPVDATSAAKAKVQGIALVYGASICLP